MSTKTKKYKVSQKITIFVEAKTKEEAIDKVVADDGNFEGWDWVAEECDDEATKEEYKAVDKNGNHYITFANNYKEAKESEGRLWNFKRAIGGDNHIIRAEFYIKAKSLEEAEEMLGDWDNYSLIDEAMNLSKEDKKIYENMEVDDDEIWTDDNNEYNQTHTAEKPIPLHKNRKEGK